MVKRALRNLSFLSDKGSNPAAVDSYSKLYSLSGGPSRGPHQEGGGQRAEGRGRRAEGRGRRADDEGQRWTADGGKFLLLFRYTHFMLHYKLKNTSIMR